MAADHHLDDGVRGALLLPSTAQGAHLRYWGEWLYECEACFNVFEIIFI